MISFHFTTLNEISETTKPPPNGRRKETAIASQDHKQFSSASEQEAKWESPGFATMGEVVVGISGASGAIYGKRLAEVLSEMGKTVRLVVTDSGKITLKHDATPRLKPLQPRTPSSKTPRTSVPSPPRARPRSTPSSSAPVRAHHRQARSRHFRQPRYPLGHRRTEGAPQAHHCPPRGPLCYGSS